VQGYFWLSFHTLHTAWLFTLPFTPIHCSYNQEHNFLLSQNCRRSWTCDHPD